MGAVVVALAAAVAVDMAISLAIIRRLRAIAAEIASAANSGSATVEQGLSPGERVPSFEAIATDGASVARVDVAPEGALLAFFAAECEACRLHMTELVKYARRRGSSSSNVLIVVDGDPQSGADLISAGSTFAQVVNEPEGGPLSRLFRVGIFPTFFVVGKHESVGLRTHSAHDAAVRSMWPGSNSL